MCLFCKGLIPILTFSHSGHEFPFSIKMSHIRDGGSSTASLGGGTGRDLTSPTDCPGVLLLDQCLPPDTQCQFILKPNKPILGLAPLIGKNFWFKLWFSMIWDCAPSLEVALMQQYESIYFITKGSLVEILWCVNVVGQGAYWESEECWHWGEAQEKFSSFTANEAN